MPQSTLRQVLTIFETANGPLSMPRIAHDLGISPEQLDAMIQHWVRKGKIRESAQLTECGTCGKGDSCAFVLEMPRTYELASNPDVTPLGLIGTPCGQEPIRGPGDE